MDSFTFVWVASQAVCNTQNKNVLNPELKLGQGNGAIFLPAINIIII